MVGCCRRALLAFAALALLAGAWADDGKIAFTAAARRRAISPANARVLKRFFARHPSSAAAELLHAANSWSPTDVPHVFVCELEEIEMLGHRLRPAMRVSLARAPSDDGQAATGAWLVRADDLSLGGQVGGALEGVSCSCETLISFDAQAGSGSDDSDGAAEAQIWCEAQLRVSFDSPRGFRRATKGPVQRIGSAALAAVLGASVGASLRSTVLALERYSCGTIADGVALDSPWAEEASDAAAEAAEARAGLRAQAAEATTPRPVAAEATLLIPDLPLAALAAEWEARALPTGGASGGIATVQRSGGGTPARQEASGLGWPALARPAADSLLFVLAKAWRRMLIFAAKLGGWARMQSGRVRAGS
ncbi:hypothetical protein T492DRAFT_986898 [Pavlovales sp. CCMP2436]|nr:hypothetical protein T492DRAFT_986898 [Pavlovales sp. CCMP2436]|mmetsp:Transcript_33539/g.83575  ORF Transcript_33539/g.83575 Transcript_33539/m.83575 type:complete len:364 (+) Transcript_33539:261-1352(+)